MTKKRIYALIAMLLILVLSLSTLSASTGRKSIDVIYNNIKVRLDGVDLDLRDALGNKVEPFIFNGTNFLPARAISEALGKSVRWDVNTNTVIIDSNDANTVWYDAGVDILNPSISLKAIGVNPSAIDAYKLESAGKEVNMQLSYNNDHISLEPHVALAINTPYQLKLFLIDGTRKIINFKTNSHPELALTYERQYFLVPAMPELGFHYPYYLVLPTQANVDKNRGNRNYLFVETHNTGVVGDDLDFHIQEALTVAEGNSAIIADELGLPRIVPIIVRPNSTIGGELVYSHSLTRNTIFLEDLKEKAVTYPDVFDDMDRVDLQVIAMIAHANDYLEDNGWDMEEKVFMWGFSASGDFTNRFSFLHPNSVKAACFGGYPVLPLSESEGFELFYPFGTSDYKKITGRAFNLTAYNSVAKFGFIGSADDNNPVLNDDQYTQMEKDLITNYFEVREYPNRWHNVDRLFAASKGKAQISVYLGAGHEIFYKGMLVDYVNFFMANRNSDVPAYVEPSDPDNTLSTIYSENTVTVKRVPFTYDKTTIIEAFWSGQAPTKASKGFTTFFLSSDQMTYDPVKLFIGIAEWDHYQDHNQMGDRLEVVTPFLTLKAKGQKDVTIRLGFGTMTSSEGDGQLYIANVVNPNDLVSGVVYTITDESGSWRILDDVKVVRP